MFRSSRRPLAALLVALVVAPASASASVRIRSDVDPAAPSGSVPKVVFTASGVAPNHTYVLRWSLHDSRGSTRCTQFGSSTYQKAHTTTLRFDPLPYGLYGDSSYVTWCPGRAYTVTVLVRRADHSFHQVSMHGFTAPTRKP